MSILDSLYIIPAVPLVKIKSLQMNEFVYNIVSL